VEIEKTIATANTGVLRSAQDDSEKLTTARSTEEAGSLRE
jgi:hypothetical protein